MVALLALIHLSFVLFILSVNRHPESMYIKQTVCTYLCIYVPVSLFHVRTARPISTKFSRSLHTNSGKVLNTSMTPPNKPPGTPNSKTLAENVRKTSVQRKMFGYCYVKNYFVLDSAGPRLASYKKI